MDGALARFDVIGGTAPRRVKAQLQLKAIYSHVLRNFDIDLYGDVYEPDYERMLVGPRLPCRARFFRRKGAVAYGYGLFSDRIPFEEFGKMFHGNDERVDQETLRLSAALWEQVAREFCG